MQLRHKTAIRSTGWKTDMLIGLPDGLFMLFFTTLLIQKLNVSIQQFYDLNIWIAVLGGVLVMAAAWQANRGDQQHTADSLTPEERNKLQHLDINEDTINHIAREMEQDASRWAKTLEQEKVQLAAWSPFRALRSAITAGIFFLLGGAIPFWPYLANENFSAASQLSLLLVFLSATVFAIVKAKVTGQQLRPVIVRYLLLTAGIWAAVYLVGKVIG